MESMFTLLKRNFDQSNKRTIKEQNIRAAYRKSIDDICLSECGVLYLVQGECPETTQICVAIALEAAEKGRQVSYMADKTDLKDVATMVVSQELHISVERILNSNLDIMEQKWIDTLIQKHSCSSFLISSLSYHSDNEALLAVKKDVEEVERLGRLTKGSLLIIDWLGAWRWDSGRDMVVLETLSDINEILEYLERKAIELDIVIVVGCYPKADVQVNAVNSDGAFVTISKGSLISSRCDDGAFERNDPISNWMKKRAENLHADSLGYRISARLSMLSKEYQEEGKTYRFALIGGDYGCPGGTWILYCNGIKMFQINDGYAARAFQNNVSIFDKRVKKQIERLGIAPITEKEQTLVQEIEDKYHALHASLEMEVKDKETLENAWRIFEAKMKMSGDNCFI